MQTQDIATAVSPEKARELLPLPYRYEGLTVQGVSRTRLTPVANPDIRLTPEFRLGLARKNLVERFIESKTAIVSAGLGVRPAAHTVRAHVRLTLIGAGLAQWVASIKPTVATATLTPRPEHLSSTGGLYFVDDEVEIPRNEFTYVQDPTAFPEGDLPIDVGSNVQTVSSPEFAAVVKRRVDEAVEQWMTRGFTPEGKSLLNEGVAFTDKMRAHATLSDGVTSAGYDATVVPKFNYVSLQDEPFIEDLSDTNEDMDLES